MFVAFYRWRVREGAEDQFVENWSAITAYFRREGGSLGSRLHKGSDGLWYGYAQWPSDEARQAAFNDLPPHPAGQKMREAIEESFPEVILEIQADYLVLPDEKRL